MLSFLPVLSFLTMFIFLPMLSFLPQLLTFLLMPHPILQPTRNNTVIDALASSTAFHPTPGLNNVAPRACTLAVFMIRNQNWRLFPFWLLPRKPTAFCFRADELHEGEDGAVRMNTNFIRRLVSKCQCNNLSRNCWTGESLKPSYPSIDRLTASRLPCVLLCLHKAERWPDRQAE